MKTCFICQEPTIINEDGERVCVCQCEEEFFEENFERIADEIVARNHL